MTVLPLSTAGGGCAKPSCGNRAAIHRHHRSHEALWFGPFAHRAGEPKWQQFCDRYHEFREEDIVRICAAHHAEIHSIYDQIIQEDQAKTGLQLYLYKWKQAEILMRKLRAACAVWLQQQTPGIDGDVYEKTKALRRSLAAKAAAKKIPSKEGHKRLAEERGQKLRRKKRRRRNP